ncbi:TPA: type II toxin-antitoxin system MqsR family toxin [Stenotrophomonas maltophilia]|nr:type II toxin-antitoxin system MqsR family toxin [Stenotrophomonas maltophilia]
MTPPPAKPLPPGVTVRKVGSIDVWEKQTPHYSLSQVKTVVGQYGASVFGAKAIQGFTAMGLQTQHAVAAILQLEPRHFFKSMTEENDPNHNTWQDVYHGPTPNGLAYIKFMIFYPPAKSSTALAPPPKLVISFKRL